MSEIFAHMAKSEALIVAFALVGMLMLVASGMSQGLTRGRIHPSAFAIMLGLALAYLGGRITHGHHGIADVVPFAGILLLGGAMLRDFAVVSTAFEVDVGEAWRAGAIAFVAVAIGTAIPFAVGAACAWSFGYTDAVSLTTIGAGANAYIIGTATGTALGAASPVIALSIATGVLKAVFVMVGTPFVARAIGLDNPRAAMIYGGVMGSVSGVTAGLAATDRRLIPYGALTSTFHTGLGCLLCPSLFFLIVRAFVH